MFIKYLYNNFNMTNSYLTLAQHINVSVKKVLKTKPRGRIESSMANWFNSYWRNGAEYITQSTGINA